MGTALYPGNLILVQGGGQWESRLIRAAQRVQYRGDRAEFAAWTHVALITEHDGRIIEATSRGVHENWAFNYDRWMPVAVPASSEARSAMVAYARAAVAGHERYGWAQIVSIGLTLALGASISLCPPGTAICSQLVAMALQAGGVPLPWLSLATVMPADLAAHFGVSAL